MNDELIRLFPPFPSPENEEVPGASKRRRRLWMRRALILMIGASLSFGLMALWLSHLSEPLEIAQANLAAVTLLRSHLEALERGDLRTAYAQFTSRFRSQMPFEDFHDVILDNWSAFSGQRLRMIPETESANRVILDLRNGKGPTGTVAEFVLVRIDNHWWIDDFEWFLHKPTHLLHA